MPSAEKIAALPAAASQSRDARHYRVLRWSESYTIPKGSKLKAIVAHQVCITADYLSKYNKSKVKPDEVTVIVLSGSAMEGHDILLRKIRDIDQAHQPAQLHAALKLGRVASLSMPTSDSLNVRPNALFDVLISRYILESSWNWSEVSKTMAYPGKRDLRSESSMGPSGNCTSG